MSDSTANFPDLLSAKKEGAVGHRRQKNEAHYDFVTAIVPSNVVCEPWALTAVKSIWEADTMEVWMREVCIHVRSGPISDFCETPVACHRSGAARLRAEEQ